MMREEQLNINPALFWDIDPSKLDFSKDSGFIITRVLMYGTENDWQMIKVYYGLEKIKNAALHARYLDKKTLAFCSILFSVPLNQFRCYTFSQLNPGPWNY